MSLEEKVDILTNAMKALADSLDHDYVLAEITLYSTSDGHSVNKCKKCSLCKSLNIEPNTKPVYKEIDGRDK